MGKLQALINDRISKPTFLDCTSTRMEDTNPELEQFRQQWRAEVSARTQTDGSRDIKSTKTTRRPPPITSLGSSRGVKPAHENEEEEPPTFHSLDGPREDAGYGESSEAVAKEPESALEHYEQAVERETTGKLGESLSIAWHRSTPSLQLSRMVLTPFCI